MVTLDDVFGSLSSNRGPMTALWPYDGLCILKLKKFNTKALVITTSRQITFASFEHLNPALRVDHLLPDPFTTRVQNEEPRSSRVTIPNTRSRTKTAAQHEARTVSVCNGAATGYGLILA